ncbi:TonB-linked outer membrane protein, SusC/RagA family [Mucilaginibacter pineti]|uniref:TonB-linked outer membrane protein, SusC/RagA family n=1 Tax=Mucilaginibacter pineti TaxID=1391627 RepID=A0A1G6UV12_9SPHI|nr:TonB-dependent receptor [Mucilaginibacter pineti]SDD44447.1 TonB-linked outer membrane protein, SusC/RagA family [Mucilaginibacter pineti]
MEISIHAFPFYKKLLKLIILLSVPLISMAQTEPPPTINSHLNGVVLDAASKEPLVGAGVLILGTTHSVSTDRDGKFSFVTGQKFPYTLVITYIGYEKQEFVANGSPVQILLKESVKSLNDVVVVGYGTQSRKSLTGSVTTVNADEIKNRPVASFDQQLQGKASGVQVSAGTGIPGDGLFFRIRGSTSINAGNDPLYVIDGVFINSQSLQKITTQGQANNPLADINPADIESISILKDADATAIYGARAANGVVLITTKRGKYNTAPKVSFNTYFGAAKAPKLWDLVTGPEHAELVNELYRNTEAEAIATGNTAAINTYKNLPFRALTDNPTGTPAARGLPQDQPTYDRLHDVFRTGFIQNYDASVTGGNDKTRYYVGGGYNSQQADLKTNDYRRASFKFNLDQKISDVFSIGTSSLLSQSYRTNARVGDGPQGGILQSALHTPTYLPKVNADGSPAKWAGFDNLDVLINNTNMHSKSTRLISNIYVDANITHDLKFRSSWSVDYNTYDEYQYWNSLTNLGAANHNLGTSSLSTSSTWTNEQTLTYNKVFGSKNYFTALVGNSVQGRVNSQTQAQGTNFPNDSFQQIASAATTTGTSNQSKNNLSSFFSRVAYNYAGKYFIEGNLRADASSKFGKDHRWGYFPSAGVAWQAKEEGFLKNVSFLSNLKIRGSIGLTGNQNGIPDFASRGLWSAGYNYQDNPGTQPYQLANPDLKWETTRQINLGLDAGFFNSRLNLEFNVYDKYTTGLLLNLPLALTSGYASIIKNAGEMSNKGFEITINSTNIKQEDFTWQTSLNISRNINKIEKLPIPIDASYATVRMVQGYSMNSFFVYKQLYVDLQDGNPVYQHADGTTGKTVTAADKVIDGNGLPKFFGGFNNTVNYKGFDLSVFFNFEYGNKVYNNNAYFLEGGGTRDDRRAMDTYQLNRWTTPGQVTDVPRLTALGTNYTLSPVSRFIENGSFLRLSNVNLGYTLPKLIAEKIKASSVRIYVSGSNLWLLTKYKGPDPEINVTADANVQGYDLGTPPIPRTLQVGANITF